ncbi:hypothetical protein MKX01_042233 [Papaver californicum]|nr:hypothetical protein MKX01_042233 [Papaver californicum]
MASSNGSSSFTIIPEDEVTEEELPLKVIVMVVIWCFSCNAYLDAQVIAELRPVYETAYRMKFGEVPPVRSSSGSGNNVGGSSVS